ncbi:MAG: FGGY family carbohydrate kinase [Candidatus Korarchaeota archaeon]
MSLIGIDLGTTACKVVAFSDEGNILAEYRKEVPVHRPGPNMAEQDPLEWWNIVYEGLLKVTKGLAVPPEAIGVTGQRESPVFLNEKGEVVHNSILWMDRRGSEIVEKLREQVGDELIKRTGVPPDPTFSVAKIGWLVEKKPEVARKVARVLFPVDYIVWKLTGVAATVPSMAYRTMLYDFRKKSWIEEWVSLLRIPLEWLPDVKPELFRDITLKEELAKKLNTKRIPIINAGGDRAAEGVGASCLKNMDTHVAMGTAHTTAVVLDEPKTVITFPCGPHVIPDKYLLEAGMGPMGATFEWIHNLLNLDISEMNKLALESINTELPLFLPFAGGSRIRGISKPAGTFMFLSLSHNKRDIQLATSVGIACEHRAALELLAEYGLKIETLKAVGGNATSENWLNLFAAVTGKITKRMKNYKRTSSLGAAIIAGIAIDKWKNVEQASRDMCSEELSISPEVNPKVKNVLENFYEKYKKYVHVIGFDETSKVEFPRI